MLTGIHFLLTLDCTYECDHCFLHCGPGRGGTFTLDQVRRVLEEAGKIETVEWIYFEGGEPFLYHPLLLEGLRLAREAGYERGIVTNSYWATTVEDAALWLRPIYAVGISDLNLSDDAFHSGEEEESQAKRALEAAKRIGIPVDTICIEKPVIVRNSGDGQRRGEPIVEGGAMLRGRAADTLTGDLPRRHWHEFTECPHEELVEPKRVHVDAFGYVHLCQGLAMGNMWEVPLSELVRNYDPESHPICEPLIRGGPAMLSEEYATPRDDTYVDACHFCYRTRMALLDRFPGYLGPRQVYGLEPEEKAP